jgi:hypothetical protein
MPVPALLLLLLLLRELALKNRERVLPLVLDVDDGVRVPPRASSGGADVGGTGGGGAAVVGSSDGTTSDDDVARESEPKSPYGPATEGRQP